MQRLPRTSDVMGLAMGIVMAIVMLLWALSWLLSCCFGHCHGYCHVAIAIAIIAIAILKIVCALSLQLLFMDFPQNGNPGPEIPASDLGSESEPQLF